MVPRRIFRRQIENFKHNRKKLLKLDTKFGSFNGEIKVKSAQNCVQNEIDPIINKNVIEWPMSFAIRKENRYGITISRECQETEPLP